MKRGIIWVIIAAVFILIGWFGHVLFMLPRNSNQITQTLFPIKPTPLAKYTIQNLSNTDFEASKIEIGDVLSETDKFTSYKYTMSFSPDLSGSLKTVSGMINIPKGEGTFPAVVMFRGFVSQETYIIGTGTKPSAKVFAENGYITIAPDFLGYADSDKEASDIFESRFQTWVTAAVTLKSVNSISKWDGKNIFIWGHSNGGQIALTTLEITGVDYPTVLWAPVSIRFPASILYYIADAEDGGKLLISKLSEFYETYNAEEFSLTNYFSKIKAPIEINQGTSDTAVPYWLSDALYDELKEASVTATYIKYPGNDHNMRPNWNTVVENSLLFFNSHKK